LEDEVLVETRDGTRVKTVTAAGDEFPEGAAVGLELALSDLYVFHPESKMSLGHLIDQPDAVKPE
jgi:hypothetical protein